MDERFRAYFDHAPTREGTDSEKWDDRAKVFGRKDVLPLWVADMDLPCAEEIVCALTHRAQHPIYGYTAENPAEGCAQSAWFKRRFSVDVDPSWILFSPSVVDSMLFSLRAVTEPGDSVCIQPPVYGPFRETIRRTGRVVVENPLIDTADGFRMDFDDLAEKFKAGAKAMMLCSPHNPVGRVWTREELTKLFALTKAYGVTVISDEIHASFVFDGRRHLSSLLFDDDCILLTSATKAFNLAGLRHSSAIIKNPALREKFRQAAHLSNSDRPNLFGALAQRTAYEKGDAWLDQCVEYIRENRDFACAFLKKALPDIRFHPLEGTYLLWLDMRKRGLEHAQMFHRLIAVGGVGLNNGLSFGKQGSGFFRLNLATQKTNIERGLAGIVNAWNAD